MINKFTSFRLTCYCNFMPHQAKLKYYSNLIIFIITFFFWELLKFYLSVFFFSNLPRSKTTTDHFTLGLSINSIRYQVASTAGRSILEFHTGFNFPVIVTNKRDRLKRQALPSNIGTNIRTSNNKKALTPFTNCGMLVMRQKCQMKSQWLLVTSIRISI